MKLLLTFVLVLSNLTTIAYAETDTELICTDEGHEHTEECYQSIEVNETEIIEENPAEKEAGDFVILETEEVIEEETQWVEESEEIIANTPDEPVSFYDALMNESSLQGIFDVLNSDVDAAYSMTEEQWSGLKAHTEEVYSSIESPDADEQDYYELIIDTVALFLSEEEMELPAVYDAPAANTIYFDLSLGNVSISTDGYSGRVYVWDGTQYNDTSITGDHNSSNVYYVFQSNGDKKGYVTMEGNTITGVWYPDYTEITGWGESIKGNYDVATVASQWITKAGNTQRAATGNCVSLRGNSTFNVLLDDVWTNCGGSGSGRTSGGVTLSTGTTSATLNLMFKGNNRLENIFYTTGRRGEHNKNKLIISGVSDSDSLTVIDTRADNTAVIGGNDGYENSEGIVLSKGYIYVGAYGNGTPNVAAIGGASNGVSDVTITNAVVTAVTSSTSAAIGGGGGGGSLGGTGTVIISGGEVYAHNGGNGPAIGGSTSKDNTAGIGIVTITGGTVTASNNGYCPVIGGGVGNSGTVYGSTEVYVTGGTVNSGLDGLLRNEFYDANGTYEYTLYTKAGLEPVQQYLFHENGYYTDENGSFWSGFGSYTGKKYYLKSFSFGNEIYLDLSMESVVINENSYSGAVYLRDNQGNKTKVLIKGEHSDSNNYTIFQSKGSNLGSVLVLNGSAVSAEYPSYASLAVNGTPWGESIKNRTDVRKVSSDWDTNAANQGRSSTANWISVSGTGTFNVTIHDIWSTKNEKVDGNNRTTGGVSFLPAESGFMKLTFVGNNRLGNLFYGSDGVYPQCGLTIGGEKADDSLTVVAITDGNNRSCSAIGASDNTRENVEGLEFTNGYIYAGTTTADTATAIGGGSNGKADITIAGGVITAVSVDSSAAIGSGFTGSNKVGQSVITIEENAVVYAYHLGGNGAAIGTSGANKGEIYSSTIAIRGNASVYAEHADGIALGAGKSNEYSLSGDAAISITGGTVTAVNKAGGRSIGAYSDASSSIDIVPGTLSVTADFADLRCVEYVVNGVCTHAYYRSPDLDLTPVVEFPAQEGKLGGWVDQDQSSWSYNINKTRAQYKAVYYDIDPFEDTIYFDLALGNVYVDGVAYNGNIYDSVTKKVLSISGNYTDDLKFYVYQSTENNRSNTGISDNQVILPVYDKVSGWAEYITNQPDVNAVVEEWPKLQKNRSLTENRVIVNGATDSQKPFDITVQNLWTFYNVDPGEDGSRYRSTGDASISFTPSTNGKMKLTFIGDNRIDGSILYKGLSKETNSLTLQGVSDEDTLTVASSIPGGNWWCSAIGGEDQYEHSWNIHIDGGTIFAGTTRFDDAAAIGGGGNGSSSVYIHKGIVTAVNASTAATIGGGQGLMGAGGKGEVYIYDGKVFAYNHGIILAANKQNYEGYYAIPCVAIGGAGSIESVGNDAVVEISGGEIFAQSIGGTAIGGGGSGTVYGGSASINISGGKVIALSKSGEVQGTIRWDWSDNYSVTSKDGEKVTKDYSALTRFLDAGTSIGGGTAYTSGGSADLTISGEDTEVYTGSIGGGNSTNGGSLGYAKVMITGGLVQGQVIMQETGVQDQFCSFTMTGGLLDNGNHSGSFTREIDGKNYGFTFIQSDGGAVYMNDSHGVTTISGGIIQNTRAENGGTVFMTGGTFTMTSQEAEGTKVSGTIQNSNAISQGGVVYLKDGSVNINDGSILNNSSGQNGGAVYVQGGTVNVTNGTLSENQSSQNGGAIYVDGGTVNISGGTLSSNIAKNNGGVVAVNNGKIVMSGGTLDSNTSESGSGGALYVSSDTSDLVSVKVFSGTLSNNESGKNGGAVSVEGAEDSNIIVQIGVNESHATKPVVHSDEGITYNHESCPHIIKNSASGSGGAFHISGGASTTLNIYCALDGAGENSNHTDGDRDVNDVPLSSFLMVEGGNVEINTATQWGDDWDEETPVINGNIHITGGQLELNGSMDYPLINGVTTVNLTNNEDYADNRDSKKSKINYHENFYVNGVLSSTFSAIDIQYETNHVIYSGLYKHDGYELYGWNTNPNAVAGETADGWFYATDIYTFKQPDSTHPSGTVDGSDYYGDLVLYAIWRINGYTIEFDPGVDDTEKWSGSVPSASVFYDQEYELPENGFIRPGYVFRCWKYNNTEYNPAETVSQLTKINDDTVTFVAQWAECDHAGHLEYEVDGNVITKTCNRCQMTGTAELSAEDAVYDGKSHYAVLKCSNEDFFNPAVTYTATKIDNEGMKTDTPVSDPSLCINAGDYTAVMEGDTNHTVSVEFRIDKATQTAPATRPTYLKPPTGENTLKVNPLSEADCVNKESNAKAEYILRHYESNVEKNIILYTTNAEGQYIYDLTSAFKAYSVLARYEGTDNYYPSDYISAEASFVFSGNLELTIAAEDGIDFWVGDVSSQNEMFLYIKLREGFEFLDDTTFFKFTETEITTTGYDLNKLTQDGVTGKLPDENNIYQYTIEAEPSDTATKLRITIGGVRKTARLSAVIKEKQHFSELTNNHTTISISRDSAFTVLYNFVGYHSDYYETPSLSFDLALPVGTTIILKDLSDSSYWYYRVNTSEFKSIELTQFDCMGVKNQKYVVAPSDLKLQFVVDFSQVSAGELISTSVNAPTNLSCTLSAKRKNNNSVLEAEVNVALFESRYKVTNVATDSESLTRRLMLDVIIGAEASKYDYRDLAIVLNPSSDTVLPADASILFGMRGEYVTYRPDKDGMFIIPLGDFKSAVNLVNGHAASLELTFELKSNMFANGKKEYKMAAVLYLSCTNAEQAPLNSTDQFASDLKFTSDIKSAEVDIVGAEHLYKPGETVTVEVNAKADNSLKLEVELHREFQDGTYANTAVQPSVSGNNYSFTLSNLSGGNYCIVATMKNTNGYVYAESRYYLILHSETNQIDE